VKKACRGGLSGGKIRSQKNQAFEKRGAPIVVQGAKRPRRGSSVSLIVEKREKKTISPCRAVGKPRRLRKDSGVEEVALSTLLPMKPRLREAKNGGRPRKNQKKKIPVPSAHPPGEGTAAVWPSRFGGESVWGVS